MIEHCKRLEQMFYQAPVQDVLPGAEIRVSEGKAEYALAIKEAWFHAAGAMHGAIYFKMLDDAAYFAAASLEQEYFMLTKSYTIHFRRPVEVDVLTAKGEVVSRTDKEVIARSEVCNSAGKVVARGEGVFVKGPRPLSSLSSY